MSQIFRPNIDIARLANIHLQTPDGAQIQAGKLWQKKPVVLVFLRHFACIACRAHAKQVWSSRTVYEAKGTNIVFIGNGSPSFIEGFKTDLGLDAALVLTDPSLESFRAAGFHHGFRYVVQMASVKHMVDLYKKGHRQAAYKKAAGTHWQMGGLLVVKTSGEIGYHYISESLGDFPEEPHYDTIIAEEKTLKADALE